MSEGAAGFAGISGEADALGAQSAALPRLLPVVLSSLRSIAGVGIPAAAAAATPAGASTTTPAPPTIIELRIPASGSPVILGLHLWKPDAAAPARVLAVDPSGPAAAAGVAPGDLLHAVETPAAAAAAEAPADVARCSEEELRTRVRDALAGAAGAVLRFGRPPQAPAAA